VDAAKEKLLEATKADSLNAEPFHMLALIAYSEGRMEDAGEMILEATTRNDSDPAMHANCGAIMNLLGRPQEAEAACRHVIDLDPYNAEAYNNLAVSLEVQGRLDEAQDAAIQAIELNPGYVEACTNLGNIMLRAGEPMTAAEAYRAAIKINPVALMARANLAIALREAGELDLAEAECRAAIKINPNFAEGYNSLGNVLKEKENWQAASEAFETAIDLRDGYADAMLNLAGVLFKSGDLQEAEGKYRNILETFENLAEAHAGLGVVLLAVGRLDEAVESFRHAVASKPAHGEAQYNLATAIGGDYNETEVSAIRELLNDKTLPDSDRIRVHFALGEINDHRGNFETAFADFDAGNQMRKQQLENSGKTFNADAFDARVDGIIATYGPDLFVQREDAGDPSDLPVFIVGMPRSGTTLVEQIIASHPQAAGKGELDLIRAHCGEDGALAGIEDPVLVEKAENYLAELIRGTDGAARITDKMPFNWLHLGQIQLMFPDAHVLYCRRDPLDTGLSCFRQYFTAPHSWACDLDDIGRYQRALNRLMDHWKNVLSLPILDVQYEDMVDATEDVSRRILDFIGLSWDDACLDFHASGRAVQTASSWQVRKPVYSTAVGRAKGYDAFLGPLKEALKD
ncbi:MAG: tetratricopeptide repeat protein, partial [Alphaproteobacteria bacterium]|nr:tetratricopeptide repeat protein [Alphaproteobacteria bacterium]